MRLELASHALQIVHTCTSVRNDVQDELISTYLQKKLALPDLGLVQ